MWTNSITVLESAKNLRLFVLETRYKNHQYLLLIRETWKRKSNLYYEDLRELFWPELQRVLIVSHVKALALFPLSVLVWELFHLQTPYAILFPKRHFADLFSEGITYVSNESKNLPFGKELNQVPRDLPFSDKFPFAAVPLFTLSWYKLWGHSSPMLIWSLTPTNSPPLQSL